MVDASQNGETRNARVDGRRSTLSRVHTGPTPPPRALTEVTVAELGPAFWPAERFVLTTKNLRAARPPQSPKKRAAAHARDGGRFRGDYVVTSSTASASTWGSSAANQGRGAIDRRRVRGGDKLFLPSTASANQEILRRRRRHRASIAWAGKRRPHESERERPRPQSGRLFACTGALLAREESLRARRLCHLRATSFRKTPRSGEAIAGAVDLQKKTVMDRLVCGDVASQDRGRPARAFLMA